MKLQNNNTPLLTSFLWPISLFIIGVSLIVHRFIGFDLTAMPGNLVDGRFNNYLLEHAYQCILNKGMAYWNAPFFFPEKDVISYSDNLFGIVPIYSIVRFWTDRETAYQILYIILVALNFAFTYVALKKLNVSAYAASIGAFIYAFSSIISIQTYHIQLLPTFVAPLAIVLFYLWLKERNNNYFYVSIFLLTYQFYCGIYMGYFLVYIFMVLLGVYLVRERKIEMILNLFNTKSNLIRTAIFSCVIISLLGILFYPYYLRSLQGEGYPSSAVINDSIPRLWCYILAKDASVIWGWTRPIVVNNIVPDGLLNNGRFLFVGIMPFVLIISAFYMYRNDDRIRYFLIASAVLFIVILSVFNFSIYSYIVYLIPGARAMRAVSRYFLLALFLWSIVSALFIDSYFSNIKKFKTLLIFALPVLLIIDSAEYVDRTRLLKSDLQDRCKLIVEKYQQQKHKNPNAVAFVSHINTDSVSDTRPKKQLSRFNHVDAMMASQVIGLPCVNGYTAIVIPDYENYYFSQDEKKLHDWLHSDRIRAAVKKEYSVDDILILR